jgi:acetyl esterase/lipase
MDVLSDEAIVFAQRLMAAGVTTAFRVRPGSYHAAEHLAPGCTSVQPRPEHARFVLVLRSSAGAHF